jgi:hypothetical protein
MDGARAFALVRLDARVLWVAPGGGVWAVQMARRHAWRL